jgi:hypothetical protein
MVPKFTCEGSLGAALPEDAVFFWSEFFIPIYLTAVIRWYRLLAA